MKIVIGSESFPPNISGVSTAAEILARNLAAAGHQVFVFAPSVSLSNSIEDDTRGYKVFRLKSIENPFRKGFRVSILPGQSVREELARINPDIVHLEDPTSICSSLLKYARKKSIPVVVTNHFNLDYLISYLKLLQPFEKQTRQILKHYLARFYNRCDKVICPTETVKTHLLEWGVTTPIVAISNGVDLARFFSFSSLTKIRSKYRLPTKSLVLYLGRIDKDKNMEVLIRSIPIVIKSSNAKFVIAGSGDELENLKKLAAELDVLKRIIWTGRIERDSSNLEQLYQAASVFVIPSKIETQSIVTMEAMAAGLPVVGANGGALPELICDSENGFLFDPESESDLAKKLLIILKNDKLRQQMSKSSLEKIAGHELGLSLEKTLKIYDQVIKNKNAKN
ncbi:MAG: glycosyltransferase [Candidatus Berkelbacteria bacterium]|nr:glycosyltransferase [Candidatus Berkelbacteria bacterium]